MSVNPSFLRQAAVRAALYMAFACAWLCAGHASAAGLTVLLADDSAPHAEFAGLLRSGAGPGAPVELLRLAAGDTLAPASAPATAGDDERSVTAGVRTRSVRGNAAAPPAADATIAVGQAASRVALDRSGSETLVLAMLSRLDYEALRSHPSFRRSDRRIGVLLRDPAMVDQMALIDALLPQKRRLGVVATVESEPLVRELERAAAGWDLQVQYAPDPTALASALHTVVARSDALMVLPDRIGDSQAATLAVLRAGAGARLPVFGASDGLVRSGGLAAAVSTPAQLAVQARAMLQKLHAASAPPGVWVEAATPATVRVNATVARGLGLRLPEERELTARINVSR